MSIVTEDPNASRVIAYARPEGRHRRGSTADGRVRRDGKFFRLGKEKFYVKGVTYGPFAPNPHGQHFASPEQTRRDFAQIVDMGANCIRIYYIPPTWFLDLAREMGLKIFLDVCWPKNLEFVDDPVVGEQARSAVRESARQCGNHTAIFALSVVNEVPSELVRFIGRERVEAFIDELVGVAKGEAPNCLVTFANYPTTEYLRPRSIDFVCFNVYLDNEGAFRNYLARLQSMAGEMPLLLGEYGVDTNHSYSEQQQAEMLSAQVRAAFDEGLVGTFVFSFTDDWFAHGYPVDNWAFGLTRREFDETGRRAPKPALEAVKAVYQKVPQAADLALPKASVIVCSYNGAETVEACLRSMRRLRYPDFEVIFVDDGSTDGTQKIMRKFPEMRNIQLQKNMGLSHARNVGLDAARGDIVVYTDSDCEADEDWLYYLAVSLLRGNHVGVGGPNLIPDDGSWVADCVGLSPGGPTHVMIDDRTAEHVPGCNMAFYAWALRQANGFDVQFRKAGDDVDVIWRLQNLNYTIGLAPAAQVWHYRRNTVKAYLRQQRGYGEAEALLKYKHPDRFNTLGASHWRGRMYGGERIGVRVGPDVIYHGLFGTGLFQSIYRRQASLIAAIMMSVEWHLMAAFMVVLGFALPPLMWVAVAMFLVPPALACLAAIQVPAPRRSHAMSRPLIAWLHYRQPITRGWARYSVRLKNKVMKAEARGFRRPHRLPFDPADTNTLRYWHKQEGRLPLLDQIKQKIATTGWRIRVDSGWNGWDLEVYGSRYVKLQITTATEYHPHAGKLTRIRVRPRMSTFCLVLTAATSLLTALLLVQTYLWPFNRLALLIPLTWWAMYCVNRWRVTTPVLGLIDFMAEKAGYWPVKPGDAGEGKTEPLPAPLPQPLSAEDAISVQVAPTQPAKSELAPSTTATASEAKTEVSNELRQSAA
jgi:glycosyltransferase involved in cell wall biosynthesis